MLISPHKTLAHGKINIGLFIKGKRPDGYHELETLFYPISLADKLVFHALETPEIQVVTRGLETGSPPEENLVAKAWKLMKAEYPKIGGLKVELEKRIPVGAGLGGGSSDAARTLLFINTYYNLDLSKRRLRQLGALLGADVPFFIDNKPMLAYGIGDELQETDFVLPYSIKLVTPDVFSSTAEAYRSLDLAQCHRDSRLEELLKEPIHEWKNCIFNDFEPSVFRKFPQLAEAKQKLYDEGALYASMTGSGSALFGIFDSADGRNSL